MAREGTACNQWDMLFYCHLKSIYVSEDFCNHIKAVDNRLSSCKRKRSRYKRRLTIITEGETISPAAPSLDNREDTSKIVDTSIGNLHAYFVTGTVDNTLPSDLANDRDQKFKRVKFTDRLYSEGRQWQFQ